MTEILLITAFNLILYFPTLKYNLIVDDTSWYKYMKDVKGCFRTLSNLKDFFTWIKHRLYGVGTFTLNIELEHLATTILHTIASCLIYVAFGSNLISFTAALLYSCNPINNQTSIWLNGRRYLFNIIIVLLMAISPYFAPLYILAIFMQVTAIFSPLLLLTHSVSPLAMLFLIPVGLLLIKKEVRDKISERMLRINDNDRKEFKLKRLIIIVKHYGHYFFKMIIPGQCFMVYDKMHYWGITEEGNKDAYSFNKDFFVGSLAILASILIPIGMPNLAVYSILMSLSILQWCAIIPVTQELADRYTGIGNIFMMFILSYVIHTYIPVYATYIALGLIVYYTCMLYKVMPMYQNMFAFWSYQRYYLPHIPSPRKFEINWLINQKDVIKAWILTREGLSYNDKEFPFLFQAAACHKAIGEFELARQFAEKAKENYYIGQKAEQEPKLNSFIDSLKPYLDQINNYNKDVSNPSRQQRRTEDRKTKKK